MKFDHHYKQLWAQIALGLGAAILFYLAIANINVIWAFLGSIGAVLRPVFIGMIIAYVLHPLVYFFENRIFGRIGSMRKKSQRLLAVASTILLVILIVFLLLLALIPQVIASGVRFFENASDYVNSLQNLIAFLMARLPRSSYEYTDISNLVYGALDNLTRLLPSQPGQYFNIITNVGSQVFDWVIGAIMAIYFLSDMDRIMGALRQLLELVMSEKRYHELRDFAHRTDRILVRYIGGSIVDGLIVGTANFVFMMIMQMPYPMLLSVLVGVTNLAPTFGPILGGILGGLILLLINPWYALWFIIFTIVLQTIDGYVIKPRLFGNTLGVSGVWILICIIVGGKAFGVPGILLSIPFAAISDFVYRESILARLRHRRELGKQMPEKVKQGQEQEGEEVGVELEAMGGTDPKPEDKSQQ